MKSAVVCVMLIVFFIITTYCWWYNAPVCAQPNPCKIEDLVDDPNDIEKAISKMGPYHNYVISPDGTLKVNRGDGKWQILKY